MNEHEKNIVIKILNEVLKSEKYRGQVYLFGSRARGDHNPHSDLDLLFDLNPPLALKTQLELQNFFVESDLPYKVDIVSEQNLLSEYRPSVAKDRKLLLSV